MGPLNCKSRALTTRPRCLLRGATVSFIKSLVYQFLKLLSVTLPKCRCWYLFRSLDAVWPSIFYLVLEILLNQHNHLYFTDHSRHQSSIEHYAELCGENRCHDEGRNFSICPFSGGRNTPKSVTQQQRNSSIGGTTSHISLPRQSDSLTSSASLGVRSQPGPSSVSPTLTVSSSLHQERANSTVVTRTTRSFAPTTQALMPSPSRTYAFLLPHGFWGCDLTLQQSYSLFLVKELSVSILD